ncbi:MAG TPA: ferritin-like domain-containing protein [Candidatus Binatia bacterium]|nr:ferritin-like domain-containing protein [Candidatus Binatia bacterium]
MGSDTYHEPPGELSQQTRDLHRGIVSLIEELEAIDWYQQRADACTDEALKRVLIHNKNEEIEHAAMTLEWLRRRDGQFGAVLRKILFTEGEITALEEGDPGAATRAPEATSLGIRSLKLAREPAR